MRGTRARRCAVLVALVGVLIAATGATAVQIVPVRGGVVEVPDFDPERYHDSASCQAALNSAMAELARQLGAIPFPPPGEPGYHEWAIAIGQQMDALGALRPHCLRLGAPGRVAARAEAQRFALAAIPVAGRLAALRGTIVRARGRPGVQRRAALSALRIATGIGGRFDLEALLSPRSFARSDLGGDRLRRGQLANLPGFANGLQSVSDWDREVVELTERRAATDPVLAENLDLAAGRDYGRPYSQLTLAERRAIVSQPGIRSQSGAIDVLLDRVRRAATAGLGVIFGR